MATKKGNLVRNSLVLFQFIISVFVINLTLMMPQQLKYVRTVDMGFDRENVLSIQLRDSIVENRYEYIKNELLEYPDIIGVSSGLTRPGSTTGGLIKIESNDGNFVEQNFPRMVVNFNYLETLGLELVEDRDFSPEAETDRTEAIIVNQKLVEFRGWDNPTGKRFKTFSQNEIQSKVIGVVKDFNVHSLHNKIQPLIIRMQHENGGRILIRYKSDNVQGLISTLQDKWKEINPNRPFVYDFLSDEVKSMYADHELQSGLVGIFSFITILISCLGLLGLASYSATRKTKEVGIRKALGSSVSGIVILLSRTITILVLVSILVSTFVSTYVFNFWLESFAY